MLTARPTVCAEYNILTFRKSLSKKVKMIPASRSRTRCAASAARDFMIISTLKKYITYRHAGEVKCKKCLFVLKRQAIFNGHSHERVHPYLWCLLQAICLHFKAQWAPEKPLIIYCSSIKRNFRSPSENAIFTIKLIILKRSMPRRNALTMSCVEDVISMEFRSKASFRRHIISVHSDQTFACRKCDKIFSTFPEIYTKTTSPLHSDKQERLGRQLCWFTDWGGNSVHLQFLRYTYLVLWGFKCCS